MASLPCCGTISRIPLQLWLAKRRGIESTMEVETTRGTQRWARPVRLTPAMCHHPSQKVSRLSLRITAVLTCCAGPNLPNVEDVYESLLKREGPFRPHPSGLNRLFFSFATIVIHECFQTSRENPWINETSSYVDLSTLYGNTEKEQPRVRTYKNGLIYPDSIASERIMMMPPGVVVVLLMFSRNHNHVAESLLSVNEDGKYKPWDQLSEEQQKKSVSSCKHRGINLTCNPGKTKISSRSRATSMLASSRP
jgi:hypothetical protein